MNFFASLAVALALVVTRQHTNGGSLPVSLRRPLHQLEGVRVPVHWCFQVISSDWKWQWYHTTWMNADRLWVRTSLSSTEFSVGGRSNHFEVIALSLCLVKWQIDSLVTFPLSPRHENPRLMRCMKEYKWSKLSALEFREVFNAWVPLVLPVALAAAPALAASAGLLISLSFKFTLPR